MSGRTIILLTNELFTALSRNSPCRFPSGFASITSSLCAKRFLKAETVTPLLLNNAYFSTGTSDTLSASQETSTKSGGFLKRFVAKMGWIDNTRARLRVSACTLYESVADHINYVDFYTYFKMPNTFNTWFIITELHVWMLLTRAMAEGAEKDAAGRFLRNCIVESLWNDVSTRAKQLSAHNPSVVRPQIQLLSEQFQAALLSYDEGISFDDKALAAALWRRFFCCKCEDYEKLELLVKYVRRQVAMLDQMSRYDFAVKPKIKWVPLIDKTVI